jgi:hypothetical protein
MKTFYKVIILTFVTNFTVSYSNAQVLSDRSNISVSAGLTIGVAANINYEYRITDNSFISAGYGVTASLDNFSHFNLTHVFLKGNGNHFFEYGYGLFVTTPFDSPELYANIRLGYRKSNNYNSRFFRTGISLTEGLYVGCGRSF